MIEASHPASTKKRSQNAIDRKGRERLTWPSVAQRSRIVVGLAFSRYARSWLASLGITTGSACTSALVGIAGAFIGFHLGVILGLLPSPLMLYFGAVAGASVVL